MEKNTYFYRSIIKDLINYYQNLDVITDKDQLSKLSDINYEIEAGRAEIKGSITNFYNDSYCQEATKKEESARIYDVMRKKVDRCIKSLETEKIELIPELYFTKPQICLDKYDRDEVCEFLKAYLEITAAQNRSQKQANRRIKDNANRKINMQNDFSEINKVFYALHSNFGKINFAQARKQYQITLSDQSSKIREQYQYMIYLYQQLYPNSSRDEQYQYLVRHIFYSTQMHIYQFKLDALKPKVVKAKVVRAKVVRAKVVRAKKVVKTKISMERKRFIRMQVVSLQCELVLRGIIRILDHLLLSKDICQKNMTDKCQRIENIISDDQKKEDINSKESSDTNKQRNLIQDFFTYNFILYMQNQVLEELRLQIYKLDFLQKQPTISDTLFFSEKDNTLKPEFQNVDVTSLSGKELQQYNCYFNFGKTIPEDTFAKYIQFIKEQTPIFNKVTGRDIHPEKDIRICRAFYRTSFFCESFQYRKNKTKENSTTKTDTKKEPGPKTFYLLWNKYISNNKQPDPLQYYAYLNALTCLIHLEYENGVEHVQCRTDLMKSIYKVVNHMLIVLLNEVNDHTHLASCTDKLMQLFEKIFLILYIDTKE